MPGAANTGTPASSEHVVRSVTGGNPGAARAGPGNSGPVTLGAKASASAGLPLRVGVVGTMSGVGATQIGTVVAVQAWAAAINARGGLRGHPVQLFVVDDGGDAARFRSALQELVEQDHVVAFVGGLTGFSISQGAVDYLNQKRVPMIGGDRLSPLWYQSPMMFPQASAGPAAIWIQALLVAHVAGRGAPVGYLTCEEVQQCKDADAELPGYLSQLGLVLKYHASASLTQPDFTAECLQAEQAGVKYFILGMDANSIRRVAQSCAQQGYHPVYEFPQTAASMASEPALDGSYFASATFPWVSSDTPATAEFLAVIRRYAPNLELSAHASSGWVAAKLFEKAAANVGPQPTSDQILQGLWAEQNDTLDGLTAPLSFVTNQPAPPRYCYFPMQLSGGQWQALSDAPTCEAPHA
jgi:branched-chain amino acid transport system substrate-binding protein